MQGGVRGEGGDDDALLLLEVAQGREGRQRLAVRDRLVAEGDEKAADKRVRGAPRLDAIRGTEFRREWKGKVHVVTATGDGRFEYGGVVYASLTAVAFAITGTHRNGVKWFGLTDRMVRK